MEYKFSPNFAIFKTLLKLSLLIKNFINVLVKVYIENNRNYKIQTKQLKILVQKSYRKKRKKY